MELLSSEPFRWAADSGCGGMREDKGLKKHTENQVSTHILGPPPPTETHTKVIMRSKQAVSCSYTEYNKNANEHNLKKNSRNIIFIYLYKLKKTAQ